MRDDHPGRGGRSKSDFWRAWREEKRRRWQEGDIPQDPYEQMRAWREFFHSYTGEWPEKHWAFGGRRFSPWHKGVATYNPFVASLLSKGGGLLPLVVMQILSEGPCYGNEIMSVITERTSEHWAANPGAIYPLMAELEEQGLVVGEWDDPDKRTQRVYQLTDPGQRELKRLRAIVRPKLDEGMAVLKDLIAMFDDEDSIDGEVQKE